MYLDVLEVTGVDVVLAGNCFWRLAVMVVKGPSPLMVAPSGSEAGVSSRVSLVRARFADGSGNASCLLSSPPRSLPLPRMSDFFTAAFDVAVL